MQLVAADWCTRKWLGFDQTKRNFTSGDLGIPLVTWWLSIQIEKEKSVYFLDSFEGRGGKGQRDLTCGVLLDDWAMLVYVDVLFTCGECSFNSLECWYYSKEWVWNLGTKVCYIASWKWNARWETLQKFNILRKLL